MDYCTFPDLNFSNLTLAEDWNASAGRLRLVENINKQLARHKRSKLRDTQSQKFVRKTRQRRYKEGVNSIQR